MDNYEYAMLQEIIQELREIRRLLQEQQIYREIQDKLSAESSVLN